MTGLTALHHLTVKTEKIRGWLEYLDEMYDVLISRKAETASVVGWDDRPRLRPCEHRLEWQRGRLCLGCDNTGLRPVATGGGKPPEEGIDPYALDVAAVRGGFTAASNTDETLAQRRSAAMQRLDHQLEALERDQAVRDGTEAEEDAIMMKLRRVSKKPRTLRRIERALAIMAVEHPDEHARLPRDARALVRLSMLVRGRVDPPPA